MISYRDVRSIRVGALVASGALAAAVLGAVAPESPALAASAAQHCGGTYAYGNGSPQTCVVPPGVTVLSVIASGSAEAAAPVAGGGKGGLAATVTAAVKVTPGQSLTILVGGPGMNGGAVGGKGTKSEWGSGGAGGGATTIGSSNAQADQLVVAAGGGGGAFTGLTHATNYCFSVYGVDGAGVHSSASPQAFTTATTVKVTTTALPDGKVGSTYNEQLAASGGTGPYTWTRVSGALPNNLALATNGTISGTPTNTQTVTATFKVTDASGITATSSAIPIDIAPASSTDAVVTDGPATAITTTSATGHGTVKAGTSDVRAIYCKDATSAAAVGAGSMAFADPFGVGAGAEVAFTCGLSQNGPLRPVPSTTTRCTPTTTLANMPRCRPRSSSPTLSSLSRRRRCRTGLSGRPTMRNSPRPAEPVPSPGPRPAVICPLDWCWIPTGPSMEPRRRPRLCIRASP